MGLLGAAGETPPGKTAPAKKFFTERRAFLQSMGLCSRSSPPDFFSSKARHRAVLGTEPRTSGTLSENHATRPDSQLTHFCNPERGESMQIWPMSPRPGPSLFPVAWRHGVRFLLSGSGQWLFSCGQWHL